MWKWDSAKGEMAKDGLVVGRGYAGAPGYKNDPSKEAIKNKGPIPRGKWKIGSTIAKHPKLGPVAIRLTPDGHNARGRSGFLIHADSIKAPGTASEGCIILPRAARVAISQSEDKELEVV